MQLPSPHHVYNAHIHGYSFCRHPAANAANELRSLSAKNFRNSRNSRIRAPSRCINHRFMMADQTHVSVSAFRSSGRSRRREFSAFLSRRAFFFCSSPSKTPLVGSFHFETKIQLFLIGVQSTVRFEVRCKWMRGWMEGRGRL